jgi:hypothetical protein
MAALLKAADFLDWIPDNSHHQPCFYLYDYGHFCGDPLTRHTNGRKDFHPFVSLSDLLREVAGGVTHEPSTAVQLDVGWKWECDQGDGTFDHDWETVHDWTGDPGVINGTQDFSYRRCRACGFEEGEVTPERRKEEKP